MANADTPFGLRPVRYVSGAPYNGACSKYHTVTGNNTAMYIGDPVTPQATASTLAGEIRQDVITATVGSSIMLGACVGVVAETQSSTVYRVASTARGVYVATDPDLLFEVQEVSGGTALTANDMGLNADLVGTGGSTVTGLSAAELNNASESTTATLDVKIVGFVNRPDNEIGEHAKWLVRINRHLFTNQVIGI